MTVECSFCHEDSQIVGWVRFKKACQFCFENGHIKCANCDGFIVEHDLKKLIKCVKAQTKRFQEEAEL